MRMDFYKFCNYISYFNYILWLLELNIVILVVNAPVILLFALLRLSLKTMLLFVAAGITIGPSVLAAFRTIPEMEQGVMRNFFIHLKKCWKKSIKLWIPIWFLFMIMIEDIQILQTFQVMTTLKWCVLLLFLAGSSFLLTFFLVWSAWDQSAKDAAAMTLKLALVKPFRCSLNFLILAASIFLLGMKPVYLPLYGISLGLFLAYKNFQPVIRFVNERPENRQEA